MGSDGSALGVLDTEEALKLARSENLDLVEVAAGARPPVARILDYGAYRYRQQKALQAQKKNIKKVDIKGVRIGMRISQNDFDHKVKRTEEFLTEGHKIKLELVMRGREQAFQLRGRAYDRLNEFIKAIKVPVIEESGPAKVGNRLNIILAPGKARPKPQSQPKPDQSPKQDNA